MKLWSDARAKGMLLVALPLAGFIVGQVSSAWAQTSTVTPTPTATVVVPSVTPTDAPAVAYVSSCITLMSDGQVSPSTQYYFPQGTLVPLIPTATATATPPTATATPTVP